MIIAMPSLTESSLLCHRLWFVHPDGSKRFPWRVRDRDSGRIAFRLTKGGAGGNKKSETRFVDDEDEMIALVMAGWGVRTKRLDGTDPSILKIDGRLGLRLERLT